MLRTMSELDDPDKGYERAFEILSEYVDAFMKGLELGQGIGVGHVKKVAFLGIGGSGIIGDAVSQFLRPLGIDVRVFKGYEAPKLAWDLVVAVSYSGETAETLNSLIPFLDSGVRVVAITSGGLLAELAKKTGASLINVRSGLPPRYAFPDMLGAALGLFESSGLHISEIVRDVEEARAFHRKLMKDVDVDGNPAKNTSKLLIGKTPIVYSYEEVRSVGYRLKCQLNENAKIFCHYADIPEAFHNDVEGLPEDFVFLIPRISVEPEPIRRGIEALCEKMGIERCISLRASGDGFRELFELFMLVDYLSVYAAVLRNENPLSLNVIPDMRKRNKANPAILRKIREKFGL